MIRIYNFPAPSRAVRPIWLCEEMGLPYEVETVSFPSGGDYRARHPLGSVPFLEDDGVAMSESIAMMFYLSQKYGPTPLFPKSLDGPFARVLQMTIFGEATLGAALNPLLAAHFVAPESEKTNWTVRASEVRCQEMLAYVADMLGEGPFLAGGSFTLADISVVVSLGMWQRALGRPLSARLLSYKALAEERPAFIRALSTTGFRH
jgi:glutathione S-transferase